jgi:hypothetical protein
MCHDIANDLTDARRDLAELTDLVGRQAQTIAAQGEFIAELKARLEAPCKSCEKHRNDLLKACV